MPFGRVVQQLLQLLRKIVRRLRVAHGGIAGSFAGLMSTMQLSEEEMHHYHRELAAGRCLVFVKAGDRYSEAVAILEEHGAHDITRQQNQT